MKIIYKNKDLVAISKPAGVPSQSDVSGDDDAMTLCARKLSSVGEPNSLWLIHRLDRVVGGVLVFARSKKSSAKLSAVFAEANVDKRYLAVVDGFAEYGIFTDFLYKDATKNKAVVVDEKKKGAKYAELECCPISTVDADNGTKTLVDIRLKTGRFHQIRAQFSSRKLPLTGDGKYGSHDSGAKFPALFAYSLSFEMEKNKHLFFDKPDVNQYPWSLFDKESYEFMEK